MMTQENEEVRKQMQIVCIGDGLNTGKILSKQKNRLYRQKKVDFSTELSGFPHVIDIKTDFVSFFGGISSFFENVKNDEGTG